MSIAAIRTLKELLLPLVVLGCVFSMLLPLPSWILDLLLTANFLLALILLVSSFYVEKPLNLSVLPTLLLLAAILRLTLNISTSRLILSTGRGGEVIEAFGAVVVGGNLIVGAVIFLMISLVQFIVVAKGSERVAEVSARFTLDALPGKQMSIDADVRAGLLDIESARLKREELQIESRFYGSLDGAMKFVKGDTIAGFAIACVNALGGIGIGVMMKGLEFTEAISRYTLLTVGDGLIAQIPALMNALAAGIIVTRVSDNSGGLAREMIEQLSQERKARALVGGMALVLALVPGMPFMPLSLLGGVLLFSMAAATEEPEHPSLTQFRPSMPPLLSVNVPSNSALDLKIIRVAVENARQRIFQRTGLILPPATIAFKDGNDKFTILVRGAAQGSEACAEAPALVDLLVRTFDGCKERLVDDAMTRRILDCYEQEYPQLANMVVPAAISLTQLTELLRALIREDISLQPIDQIFQAVCEKGHLVQGDVLLEEVRIFIRSSISSKYAPGRKLEALALHPAFELEIVQAKNGEGLFEVSDIRSLADQCRTNPNLPVICSRRSRGYLARILRTVNVKTPVLAYEEIEEDIAVKIIGTISEGENENITRLAA